jgi:hypothetical protein
MLAEDVCVQSRTQIVVAVKWGVKAALNKEYLFEPGQRLFNNCGILVPKAILSPNGLKHSLICMFNPTNQSVLVAAGTPLGLAKPL